MMIHTAMNSMRHTTACLICGKVHACVRTGRLDLGQRQHVHRGEHCAEELGHRGLGYGCGEDAHGSYHEVGECSVCSEGGGLILVGRHLVFKEILIPELVMERLTCCKRLVDQTIWRELVPASPSRGQVGVPCVAMVVVCIRSLSR